jgi:hypothetical protein
MGWHEKKKAFVRVGDRPMGIDVGKQTPGIEDGHDDWAMEPTAMPKTAAVTRKAIVHGHQVQEMHDGIGRGIDGCMHVTQHRVTDALQHHCNAAVVSLVSTSS